MKPLLEDLFTEPLVEDELLCDLTYEASAPETALRTYAPVLAEDRVDKALRYLAEHQERLTRQFRETTDLLLQAVADQARLAQVRAATGGTGSLISLNAKELSVPAPIVHVPAPIVHVEAPIIHLPPAQITVLPAPVEVTIAAPIVNVPEKEVHVHVREQPAPQVHVHVPEAKPSHKRVERDDAGKITGIVEET